MWGHVGNIMGTDYIYHTYQYHLPIYIFAHYNNRMVGPWPCSFAPLRLLPTCWARPNIWVAVKDSQEAAIRDPFAVLISTLVMFTHPNHSLYRSMFERQGLPRLRQRCMPCWGQATRLAGWPNIHARCTLSPMLTGGA